MSRQLHLVGFLKPAGEYLAGWRHPDAPARASTDLEFLVDQVGRLEAAHFDAVFLPDLVGVPDAPSDVLERVAVVNDTLEPFTLLGALAAVTERIGLVASASTTYSEPESLARLVSSVDRLSQGRAGWNVVTSLNESEARNHGQGEHLAHADRYERAERFVDRVDELWAGPEGESVGVHRPVQSRPVVAQAGSSPAGRRLAARVADLVFTRALPLDAAVDLAASIRTEAAAFGRGAAVRILPELSVVVAETRAEAEDRFAAMRALLHPRVALADVEYWLGRHLSDLPLDAALPEPAESNGSRGAQAELYALARRDGLTVGGLVDRIAAGDGAVIGSAADVADHIEEYFVAGAADGFTVSFPWLPETLVGFTELVVPELRRRGLFRSAYEGATLRGHLGLDG